MSGTEIYIKEIISLENWSFHICAYCFNNGFERCIFFGIQMTITFEWRKVRRCFNHQNSYFCKAFQIKPLSSTNKFIKKITWHTYSKRRKSDWIKFTK